MREFQSVDSEVHGLEVFDCHPEGGEEFIFVLSDVVRDSLMPRIVIGRDSHLGGDQLCQLREGFGKGFLKVQEVSLDVHFVYLQDLGLEKLMAVFDDSLRVPFVILEPRIRCDSLHWLERELEFGFLGNIGGVVLQILEVLLLVEVRGIELHG